MIRKLPLLLLACLFLFGCEKEEINNPEEGKLAFTFSLQKHNVTTTTANFTGTYQWSGAYGEEKKAFGARLIDLESNTTTDVLNFDNMRETTKTFLLENLSVAKTYSLYLFAGAGETEWQSDTITFTTVDPKINSLSYYKAAVGDTLKILGEGFPEYTENISVTFGEISAKVVKAEDNVLMLIVPQMDFGPKKVTVRTGSFSYTFEKPFQRASWEYVDHTVKGYGYFLFSIGNKAYLEYGMQLWEFDSETEKFSRKADLPSNRYHNYPVSTSTNGKGYLVSEAKEGETNKLYEYDPQADLWKMKEELIAPSRSYYFAIYPKDGVLHLHGGYDILNKIQYDDLFEYDVLNDLYGELPAVTEPINRATFFNYQGFSYAISKKGNRILKFDDTSQSWKVIDTYPIIEKSYMIFFIKEKVYFISPALDKAWSYKINTKEWLEEGFLAPDANTMDITEVYSQFSLSGKGYFGFGTGYFGYTFKCSLE